MSKLNPYQIPAVAKRIAYNELLRRVCAFDAALAKGQAESADLVKQLNSVRDELERVRGEQAACLAEVQAITSRFAGVTGRLDQLSSALAEREMAAEARQSVQAETQEQIARLTKELADLEARGQNEEAVDAEIATCRALAHKCIFIVGFGRSNTTITQEILNCAPNALLLGEANFFLGNHGNRFSDWYNNQHRQFLNQITKSTYAPDLLPERSHSWWEWLDSASKIYDFVGEKIAFSDYHLGEAPPDRFMAFHEARFLTSRYIFMLRNPIEVLLSAAKLLQVEDDAGVLRLCAAWLTYIQLWSDSIRVFPSTLSLLCERFGKNTVSQLETFTGLEIGDAMLLLSNEAKGAHELTDRFPTLVRLKPALERLYADVVAAVDENPALWQAEQKRNFAVGKRKRGAKTSGIAAERPLGRVSVTARELRQSVQSLLDERTSDD